MWLGQMVISDVGKYIQRWAINERCLKEKLGHISYFLQKWLNLQL